MPWTLKGIEIFKVVPGTKTKDELIQMLRNDATDQRWVFRIGGLLMAWFGLQMFVGPLTVAPDIIPMCGPMIGDMIGAGLCVMTLLVATSTVFFVAAVAWVFARPMIGEWRSHYQTFVALRAFAS